MPRKYRVRLSEVQRGDLEKLTRNRTIKVRKYKRARVLLLADEAHREGGLSDREIGERGDTSVSTVQRIRRRFF